VNDRSNSIMGWSDVTIFFFVNQRRGSQNEHVLLSLPVNKEIKILYFLN